MAVSEREALEKDIARVEAKRNNPDTIAYMDKHYGGVDAYLKSQYDRLAKTTVPNPNASKIVPASERDAERQALERMIAKQSDAYYKNQQAQLNIRRANELAALQKAYEEAVRQGKMSVREAEQAFEQQKLAIEENKYQDAQRTNVEAERRGIGSSQQMMGMIASDNARANKLHSQNMSERDRRIADVQDRIRQITLQRDIDQARIQAEYDAGLLGARSQADMMQYQGMFDLGRDDYTANRNQAFQKELLEIGQGYQKELLEIGQGYTQDNMRLGSQLKREEMDIMFKNTLEQMAIQHGYDLAKIDKQTAGQIRAIEAQGNKQLEVLMAKINAERQALYNMYQDPNSIEFKARLGEINDKERMISAQIMQQSAAEAFDYLVKNNPNLPAYQSYTPEPPKDYRVGTTTVPGAIIGEAINAITGYNKKLTEYEQKMLAIQTMEDYLSKTGQSVTWTQPEKEGFWEAVKRHLSSLKQ